MLNFSATQDKLFPTFALVMPSTPITQRCDDNFPDPQLSPQSSGQLLPVPLKFSLFVLFHPGPLTKLGVRGSDISDDSGLGNACDLPCWLTQENHCSLVRVLGTFSAAYLSLSPKVATSFHCPPLPECCGGQ